ncbi:hypothetical protein DRQ33_08095, partial [bacterium]
MLFIVAFGLMMAQEPPPLSAALTNPGYRYAPSGAITVCITPACSLSNPAGTHYQFKRNTILAAVSRDSITPPMAENCCTFYGAEDGEIFTYYVRAILDEDTSYWSDSVMITHDLNPPEHISYLVAQHCCSGTECSIYLTWQRVDDFALSVNGSQVRGYGIYRSPTTGGIDIGLGYITGTTPALTFIPSDGSEIYNFVDTTITPGATYRYTVVAFDSAGVPTYSSIGHYQKYDNPVVTVSAIGPGLCDYPLRAVLEPIPPVIDSSSYTVSIDAEAVWLSETRMYQFIREDVSCGTMDTTIWTNIPYFTWSLRDCHSYNFYARIRDDAIADTSDWFMRGPILVDRSGPTGIDSTVAQGVGEEIHINFFISDEAQLDCLTDDCGFNCGIGVMQYKLYRVNYDSLDSFFPYDPYDTEHFLYTYSVADTYATDLELLFRDDGSILPLDDNETYMYILVLFDSLGHYTYYSSNMDTATADLGIVPPRLIPLDTWSTGDCATIRILDTSYCDFESLYVQ